MFNERLKALAESLGQCEITSGQGLLSIDASLHQACRMIQACQMKEGVVYVVGNGGSAGIASHFSTDLMKTLRIRSQTLYDSNLMTCLSNDFGYEEVFRYPLDRMLKPVDLLVAISSSGKSANILNAVDKAAEFKSSIITLSGFHPTNPLRSKGQLNFWINRNDYGLVESAHFFLLHSLVDLWNHFPDFRTLRQLTEFSHSQCG